MDTSLYRTGAADRQLLRAAKTDALAAAPDYDQKPWGLLYRALEEGMGVNPKTFQMIYPFTMWDWATQQVGFIGADQYDFCSVTPQWSAVGQYVSSGDRLNQAYNAFLDVIMPATDDAELRRKIAEAQDALVQASNNYTTVYMQAESVYRDDPNVQNNIPSFTQWLGTPKGKPYQTQLTAAELRMNQAQKNYSAVVAQAETPGLEDALAQFANKDFYSKLNSPGLATFPKVPYYQVSQNAREWLDKVLAGEGPAGATIGFNNRDQSYDYSRTWAGASARIVQVFWGVHVNGQWENIKEFETDQELNVSVEFEAVDVIQIQPSDWYNGSFVRSHSNGPFVRGYSAYGGNNTQAVFGDKGFLNLLKTGMFIGYKPTFTITVSQSTFNSFVNKFKAATGIRIGPFFFSAEGGSEHAGWEASSQGKSFTGTSVSNTPLIFGINISELPNGSNARLAAPEEKTALTMGTCYGGPDCTGDIYANNVPKGDCFRLLNGRSWKAHGAPRCWEN